MELAAFETTSPFPRDAQRPHERYGGLSLASYTDGGVHLQCLGLEVGENQVIF